MLINTDKPNIMWEDWKAKFLAVADIHAPYVTRNVRNECTLDYGRNKKINTCLALWKHHVNLLLQSFRSVSSDLHQC